MSQPESNGSCGGSVVAWVKDKGPRIVGSRPLDESKVQVGSLVSDQCQLSVSSVSVWCQLGVRSVSAQCQLSASSVRHYSSTHRHTQLVGGLFSCSFGTSHGASGRPRNMLAYPMATAPPYAVYRRPSSRPPAAALESASFVHQAQ